MSEPDLTWSNDLPWISLLGFV